MRCLGFMIGGVLASTECCIGASQQKLDINFKAAAGIVHFCLRASMLRLCVSCLNAILLNHCIGTIRVGTSRDIMGANLNCDVSHRLPCQNVNRLCTVLIGTHDHLCSKSCGFMACPTFCGSEIAMCTHSGVCTLVHVQLDL